MSTTTNFGGRRFIEPGAYARTINGAPAPSTTPDSGTVLLIDTGSGAGWGSGAGIAGQQQQGKPTVQKFDDLASFQRAVRGGLHYDLASYLFNPGGDGTPGITRLLYARACATTKATITIALGTPYGTMLVYPTTEGAGANGTLVSDLLTLGFGARLVRGTVNTSKVQLRFYQGGYAGADANGIPYTGFTAAGSTPVQLCQSPEVASAQELVNCMKADATFAKYFTVASTSTPTATVFDPADLPALVGWKLATGSTETYGSQYVLSVLDAVSEEGHTYILSDVAGADPTTGAKAATNSLLAASLADTPFPRFLVLGGGSTADEYADSTGTSLDAAAYFNSPGVVLVHGGVQVSGPPGYSLLTRNSLYLTAITLGMKAGQNPEEPITHKGSARIKGLVHEPGKADRERGLQGGVLHYKYVNGLGFVVNQGINTLQQNTALINPDGHSHDWAVESIDSALINQLQVAANLRFVGVPRSRASSAEVKSWTEGFLQSLVATPTRPGLLLRFESVAVSLVQDSWFVQFGYVGNGPINKLFFTPAKV